MRHETRGTKVGEVVALVAIDDEGLRARLATLCRDICVANETIAALDATKREWVAEAGRIAEGVGATRITSGVHGDRGDADTGGGGWQLTRVAGRVTRAVVAERLLELGVELGIVQEAIVEKVGEPYWVVTVRRARAEIEHANATGGDSDATTD